MIFYAGLQLKLNEWETSVGPFCFDSLHETITSAPNSDDEHKKQSSRQFLFSLAQDNDMIIANTFYPKPQKHRLTYKEKKTKTGARPGPDLNMKH